MGVTARWWRRAETSTPAESWGGPGDVTLAPPEPARRPPEGGDAPAVPEARRAPDRTVGDDDRRAEPPSREKAEQQAARDQASRDADERRAEERRAAETRAAEQRAAREQAERDRTAREAEERRAAERKAADEKAERDRVERERAERERAGQERAERERAERERAERERAAQVAAEARVAEEEAAEERAAQERAAQERAAQEQAAQERIEAERRAVEREVAAARETVPSSGVPGAAAWDPEAGRRERRARRRRVLIVFLIALLAVAAVWVVPRLLAAAFSLGSEDPPPAVSVSPIAAPVPPPTPAPVPELPRGGTEFFPAFRVVAYYGTPDNPEMGVLGSGSPEEMADRLEAAAAPFATAGRAVLPAMELIMHVADGAPGPDGNYSHAIDEAQAWRYLAVARAHRQVLVLDLQPGSTDFLTTARPWERILREPDVGLALDPEWRMPPGQVPGQQIGTVTADEVNETSSWLAEIVRTSNLPQKLFVVHQFTPNMITNPERLATPPELAVVQHVDGFGSPPDKIAKYRELVRPGHLVHGFKLFYTEDTPVLDPRQTLGLAPVPDFVTYQ